MRQAALRLQVAKRLAERRVRERTTAAEAVSSLLRSTPVLVHELTQRLPPGASTVSAAQLVAGLSFRESTLYPTTNRSAEGGAAQSQQTKHDVTCPVRSGAVLLSAFTDGHLCRYCAERRLHQLAAEQLADELCSRSVPLRSKQSSPPHPHESAAPRSTTTLRKDGPLAKAITQTFGEGKDALRRDLVLYATMRRTPGRTYLVWNSHSHKAEVVGQTEGAAAGTLQIVNLPQGQVPQSFGLYPLLALDCTEAT